MADLLHGLGMGRVRGRSRTVVLSLTPAQLDALISVVEMALEGSGATFEDWLDANGSRSLAVVERQLRRADKERKAVRS